MCKKLLKETEEGVESMKKKNESIVAINSYIEDMGTGGAAVCSECEKYQECFKG